MPTFDIEEIFQYHPPDAEQQANCVAIRASAKSFARVLLDNTPPGPDQSAAMRHLREAVMTANAAVALRGKL